MVHRFLSSRHPRKLGETGIEAMIAYKAKRNKPLVNWEAPGPTKMAFAIRFGAGGAHRRREEPVWDGEGSGPRAGPQHLPP